MLVIFVFLNRTQNIHNFRHIFPTTDGLGLIGHESKGRWQFNVVSWTVLIIRPNGELTHLAFFTFEMILLKEYSLNLSSFSNSTFRSIFHKFFFLPFLSLVYRSYVIGKLIVVNFYFFRTDICM